MAGLPPKRRRGRPDVPDDEKRLPTITWPVDPQTKGMLERAAEKLNKKGPGWLIDDLARAIQDVTDEL
jgi:hypothetical protein